MDSYKIVRFFQHNHPPKVIKRGLTLVEARAYCRNPETSSRTATGDSAKLLAKRCGPWFDGYDKEGE